MATAINRVLFAAFFLVLFNAANAQPGKIPAALQEKIQGKTTLASIMEEVDKFYNLPENKNNFTDGEDEEGNPYTHWKRWEWWMSSHLDGNNRFVNYKQKNNEAIDVLNSKWRGSMEGLANQLKKAPAGFNPENRNISPPNNPNSIEAAFGDWTFIGPTADGTGPGDIKGVGRLDRIAFHPTDANTFYVGAPSGNLWKTTNAGTSWASVTDGLSNPGVAGIAISPTNGNLLYFLSGDGDSFNPGYLVYDFGSSRASSGVYKSSDGGTSWSLTGPLFNGTYEGHRLTVSNNNGNYLFAATSQGIYRTTDGGTTWTQVKTGEHWDIKFKPGDDSTVYATSGSAIFYSTQGGRSGTWNTATTDFSVSGARRIELAVSANNAAYVYALCGAVPSSGTFTGIFRSTNSGTSYTRRCNTPNILNSSTTGAGTGEQSDYDLGITVKGNDAERIATCGLCVWRSSTNNGGSVMTKSTVYRESFGLASEYIHPDVHGVAYNPLNNNLYAISDGGIYRSTDDGVSWTNITNGMATTQFYTMSMRDIDSDGDGDGVGFLAGAQDNGMKYRPNSGSTIFNHVICCDGYGVAIDADDPNILYMNINDNFYRSTNGGTSTIFVSSATFFSPIAIDYTNPDTVYLGGTSTTRSYNGFTSAGTAFAGNTRRVLITCPSNGARLYGSSGTTLIRSDDRAATWVNKHTNAGWPAGSPTVNDIEVYPTNSSEVYACFGGYASGNKVVRSLDGGDNWTNWSGTLPNIPCYSLAVATEGVYVGTEFGVFFRGFSMTDWVPFYNQMPKTPVTELAVNDNGLIYAVTFGRGAWLSNRRTACASLLTISGSRTGSYYYEAATQIDATITTPGTYGDSVYAQAGSAVVMNPGFEIKAGSYFKGYISPCSNGGLPNGNLIGGDNNEMLVPHIIEIKDEVKRPVQKDNYIQLVNGNIEFNLTEKGTLKMYVKQKNGEWAMFYPQQIFYPGFYLLKAPNSPMQDYKFILNGKEVKQLKGVL